MKSRLYQAVMLAPVFALVIACAMSTMETESIKTFSLYKQKTLDELGSFNLERRVYIYETVDELANQLRTSPKFTPLKKEKRGTAFEGFPILELSDRDLDGKADEFSYLPERGEDTQEFGFIFDLNRDGKVDYLVFNGGLIPTKGFEKIIWQNYHGIDTNYDGKVDIFVYSNNIDLDGDNASDEGISGWLYDTDFDSTVDKGEYLGENFIKPIGKKGGVFIIKTVFGEKEWGKEPNFEKDFFMNLILTDINSLMP